MQCVATDRGQRRDLMSNNGYFMKQPPMLLSIFRIVYVGGSPSNAVMLVTPSNAVMLTSISSISEEV